MKTFTLMALGATMVAARSGSQQPFDVQVAAPIKRVDVTIGVMSRCPDALFFENAFARTLERVNQKIDLSLEYIATRNHSAPFQATCKHGKEECRGNIHQLCIMDALKPSKAGKRYDLGPSAAQRLWWDFVQCENYEGGLKRIGEESLARQCIDAIGGMPQWEADGIKECVEGPKGQELLKASIQEVKRRDIVNSATLQIEGKTVCIRDDKRWKNCSGGHETIDWTKQIEDAYLRKNPGLPTLSARHDLHKRQGPPLPGNGTSSSPAPSASQTNDNGQQGAPLSVFTFIIAIALFVLVVSFVLLRIFVRNRRLRRLGIYPDGPIDRLLGGTAREYEDTLAPPRLWEAKIAEVHFGGAGDDVRAEKSALGGGVGAGDVKQHGWDALMPVSAALPPNLYPLLYEPVNQPNSSADPPPTYPPPPPPNAQTNMLGRHMPQFLRRQTGDAADAGTGAAVSPPSHAAPVNQAVTSDPSSAVTSAERGDNEERLAASVNVTVLIAMPSPRTVFPTSRLTTTTSNASLRPRHGVVPAGGKLEEVEEDADGDQDGASLKGKARRAPSLRSVKSATSIKSVAEARREAFFNQALQAEEHSPAAAAATLPAPAYENEEEEELPELMFGTASVPIFAKMSGASADAVSRLPTVAKLTQPSRADILGLVANASKAKERKVAVEVAAAEKMRKQEEGDMDGARRSNADTSVDGDGLRSTDDMPQGPMGNVASRMLQVNGAGSAYEMSDMGPSRSTGPSRSFEVQTPNTLDPLMHRIAPLGVGTEHRQDDRSRSNLTIDVPASPSAYTAQEGTLTPTNSFHLTGSDARRNSITSWHTGMEDDAQAARALAEQDLDIGVAGRHR